jgi:hypothetical protein
MFKDLDNVFKEVDNVFKQVDVVFKQMEKKLDEVQTESDAVYNSRQKWEPYTSWMPRKIGKRWYWHSPIYRKHQFNGTKSYFIYGTSFDVLKESK